MENRKLHSVRSNVNYFVVEVPWNNAPGRWNCFSGITHKKTVHPVAEGIALEAFNIISDKVYSVLDKVKMFISKEDATNWTSFHFEETNLTKISKGFYWKSKLRDLLRNYNVGSMNECEQFTTNKRINITQTLRILSLAF